MAPAGGAVVASLSYGLNISSPLLTSPPPAARLVALNMGTLGRASIVGGTRKGRNRAWTAQEEPTDFVLLSRHVTSCAHPHKLLVVWLCAINSSGLGLATTHFRGDFEDPTELFRIFAYPPYVGVSGRVLTWLVGWLRCCVKTGKGSGYDQVKSFTCSQRPPTSSQPMQCMWLTPSTPTRHCARGSVDTTLHGGGYGD